MSRFKDAIIVRFPD